MFMNKTVNLLDEQLDAVGVTLCEEELRMVGGGSQCAEHLPQFAEGFESGNPYSS
jgi:hypothetical protein